MSGLAAPLEGIIVIALEAAVSAPFATRQLADLGATVIKIERPGEGDFSRGYDSAMGGASAFFVWANRAKQSIVLNVKDPADRETFDRLVASADVFVQNLTPSAARRLGVAAEQLREIHPQLIACDISGYGVGGPRTDDKAYDLTIQAEGGAIALTGTAETACKVGFSVADISTSMYALSSILAALYRRERTGVGATIDVSMLESIVEWTAAPTYAAVGSGVLPDRAGHRHTMIAPYGVYPLSDGSKVLIAVQSNQEWAAFAESVLGSTDLIDDDRFRNNADRVANIDDLETVILDSFSAHSADEIRNRLRDGKIAHSSVRTPPELWDHEQLRARDHFVQVATPTGPVETYASPFHIDGVPAPNPSVPALGEHDPELIARLLAGD